MKYVNKINEILHPNITEPVKVLDLFAGCGGLSLGFEAVGFETIGYECVESASETYNKNLKVIESIRIENNKLISIVEAGEVYLVVACGKDEIHLLAQLTREQLKDFSFEQNNSATTESFQELFAKVKNKFPKKQG